VDAVQDSATLEAVVAPTVTPLGTVGAAVSAPPVPLPYGSEQTARAMGDGGLPDLVQQRLDLRGAHPDVDDADVETLAVPGIGWVPGVGLPRPAEHGGIENDPPEPTVIGATRPPT
jgi:hypothetical protein